MINYVCLKEFRQCSLCMLYLSTNFLVFRPSSAHGKRDSDESPDDDNDVDWSYHVDKKGLLILLIDSLVVFLLF